MSLEKNFTFGKSDKIGGIWLGEFIVESYAGNLSAEI